MRKTLTLLSLMIVLLSAFTSGKTYAQVLATDSTALVDFYNATDGPNWTDNSNWLTGTVDTWFGIETDTIDAQIRVNRIQLPSNNLVGVIPASIDSLDKVAGDFDLSNNKLSGSIPAGINDMTNVRRLLFSNNLFSGTLPTGISGMTSLLELDISNNPSLTGAFPVEVFTMTGLLEIIASNCGWTGALDATVNNLDSLERLYFNDNMLTSIPVFDPAWKADFRIRVQNNKLEFGSIEPNVALADTIDQFLYSPQAKVGTTTSLTPLTGDTIHLTVPVSGDSNVYQWYKDGIAIAGATNDSLSIETYASATDDGAYNVEITNTVATDLTITSQPFVVGAGPSAASFITAESSDDGERLTLTFDKNMSEPIGFEGEFTITVNGSPYTITESRLNTDETKIRLFVDPLIEVGDTIVISYAPANWTAADFGPVTAFGPVGVVNDTKSRPMPTAAASDATGRWVIVTFDKAMDDPAGQQADFTIDVDGTVYSVDSTALDPGTSSNIWLRLDVAQAAFTAGQCIKVSHTQNMLLAADGGLANSFTDVAVSNTQSPAIALVSANTDLTGALITLVFDQPLDVGSIAAGDFSVIINGTAATLAGAVAGSASTNVDLSGLTIAPTDVVTLSYAQGSLSSAAKRLVDSFGPAAVTVGVPNPAFVSAATNTAGSMVTVTFDVAMAAAAAVDTAAFTVTVNGTPVPVTAIAAGSVATEVDLTLATAASAGDAITITYAPGTILAGNGGVLAAFGPAAVTNSVPATPLYVSSMTNVAGTEVHVTFDQDMATVAAADTASFTVDVNGTVVSVSAAALDAANSKVIILTLNGTVANGDAVTVAYAPGTVMSAAGASLAAFAASAVTNNVPSIPTAVSAETTMAGDMVKITFSEAMAMPATPGDFTVTVDGTAATVSAAMVDATNSSIIGLTITPAVTNGQTVTVDYTAGTVASAGGGSLGAFTGLAVTNTVPAPPTPATFTSAATSADGSTVSLTFSDAMADPSAEAANFTVDVNGTAVAVTAVALDPSNPNIVILTLATAVANGDAVSVSYSGGALAGANGAGVAGFGPESVTNSAVLSVDDSELAQAISLFPNPSNGLVEVKVAQNALENLDLKLYNSNGLLIWNQTLDGNYQFEFSIDLSKEAAGVYLLQIISNQEQAFKRIIKK